MKNPQIMWAQNNDYIYLDIHVEPNNNNQIKITKEGVYFKQDEYECDIVLHANIIEQESIFTGKRIYEFKLKKEDDYEWVQLLKDKYKYDIKVNWDKFDIDEEEYDMTDVDGGEGGGGEGGMPDMASMMAGMGGGEGGMPDMASMMAGMGGGEGGMPDMASMMGQCCKDENCDGCEDDEDYEDDDEDVDVETEVGDVDDDNQEVIVNKEKPTE